jgi:hypothetical protein
MENISDKQKKINELQWLVTEKQLEYDNLIIDSAEKKAELDKLSSELNNLKYAIK